MGRKAAIEATLSERVGYLAQKLAIARATGDTLLQEEIISKLLEIKGEYEGEKIKMEVKENGRR